MPTMLLDHRSGGATSLCLAPEDAAEYNNKISSFRCLISLRCSGGVFWLAIDYFLSLVSSISIQQFVRYMPLSSLINTRQHQASKVSHDLFITGLGAFPSPIWSFHLLSRRMKVAIIATDIAEVIGTAIGLNLLFGIPA